MGMIGLYRAITRCSLAVACLSAPAGWVTPSLADGALAVGMPAGNPSNGFRHTENVGRPDAATASSDALKDCRTAKNANLAAACAVISTFKDQCVAVAVNGDAAKTENPVIAAGWAIAPDAATATARAKAQCDAMRKGRAQACDLDTNVLCDGKARVATGNEMSSGNPMNTGNPITASNAQSADALTASCRASAISGQLAAALTSCNQSLALRPNDAATLDDRGLTYLKLGQYDNAIADYNAALRINPKLASSLFGRGFAKLKKNDDSGGTDIIDARKIQADIGDQMIGLGLQ
jgi:tetratricopeptide (TPR) repeat protein